MVQISEITNLILAVCAGISCIGAAAIYIAKAFGWIRKPERKQDETLKDHEARIVKLELKTAKDFEEIEELKTQNFLLLNTMLASIRHQIDGNDIDGLKEAQDDLEHYIKSKAIYGREKK